MSSTADKNFTVRLTLSQANLVRRALESYRVQRYNESILSPEDTTEAKDSKLMAGQDSLEAEALLRISF